MVLVILVFFCLLSTTFEMAIAAFFFYEPPAAIFPTGSVLGQQVELSMNAYVNIKNIIGNGYHGR